MRLHEDHCPLCKRRIRIPRHAYRPVHCGRDGYPIHPIKPDPGAYPVTPDS